MRWDIKEFLLTISAVGCSPTLKKKTTIKLNFNLTEVSLSLNVTNLLIGFLENIYIYIYMCIYIYNMYMYIYNVHLYVYVYEYAQTCINI